MDILFLLVPMSVLLALLVIVLFAWALQTGQFDDIDAEGARILFDGDQPYASGVDAHQLGSATGLEQSAARPRWASE
jgi:cbb3-type cytochrome oxidase maturation protein